VTRDVLVIDDWAIAPLSELELRDYWEICEDHYQVRFMILTSQLPVSRMIGSQPSNVRLCCLAVQLHTYWSGEQICAPADYSLCLRSG
jgi:hypothetical protein